MVEGGARGEEGSALGEMRPSCEWVCDEKNEEGKGQEYKRKTTMDVGKGDYLCWSVRMARELDVVRWQR